MNILFALDSFKGCLTSAQACAAAAGGVGATQRAVYQPVSDGGEGWLEAFEAAASATPMQRIHVDVLDPLRRPVRASYLLQGDTAIVESAQASGLTLLTASERRPRTATSYGTGQLLVDARRRGARHIVVGLGGSATSDAGQGLLEAMATTDFSGVSLMLATDVQNPLCGQHGAARVFAPQKGATPADVEWLAARDEAFARESARRCGRDCSERAGAGAAGGMGYALMQYYDAQVCSGIDYLLDHARFDRLLADADMVVTGEGRADRQTLMGKVAMGILRRARRFAVPVVLLAGSVDDASALLAAGFSRIVSIHPDGQPLSVSMRPDVTRQALAHAVANLIL